MAFSTAIAEKDIPPLSRLFGRGGAKRSWNIFRDIPWNKLDPAKNTERIASCIETFCSRSSTCLTTR